MRKILIPLMMGLLAGSVHAEAVINGLAPNCSVKSLDSKQTLNLADHAGKVAYIDFWASWCGPCLASFPFMNEMHKTFKDQGLDVVAVDLDEEREDALAFLKKHPAQFPVVLDPEGNCPSLYNVSAMPSSFFVDRKGQVRYIHLGFRKEDEAAIREQIVTLLNEK